MVARLRETIERGDELTLSACVPTRSRTPGARRDATCSNSFLRRRAPGCSACAGSFRVRLPGRAAGGGLRAANIEEPRVSVRPAVTLVNDTKAEQGGVTEDDWRRMDELLHGSWRSLHAAVNP